MAVPTIVSLKVVKYENFLMFLVPKNTLPNQASYQNVIRTADGDLQPHVWAMHFGSYDDRGREVDTPCLLFRRGEYFDHGILAYFGGQDSGYLTWGGFSHLKADNPRDAHRIHASWFMEGDTISFITMPRNT